MTTIQLPAIFDNLSLRKDGSVSLKFETRELTGQEITDLLGFRNTEGWLTFQQNKELPAPIEERAELDLKSISERIRNALYVLYKDEPQTETFDTFYNKWGEKIITGILSKVKKK